SGQEACAAPIEIGNFVEIVSPMVGTFYRASAPGADPCVDVGDTINEETVVCIIEAMKIMNEVKAEMAGEVVEAYVSDGEAIEFGQPLFRVKPA
ncbi:MAG: acetyl-CoA carboxylase biotin carboxyl carrier protein, partial [Planctomycetota bacterium]